MDLQKLVVYLAEKLRVMEVDMELYRKAYVEAQAKINKLNETITVYEKLIKEAGLKVGEVE